MTPLAPTVRFDGFNFRLVQRVGDVALFEKRKPTHTNSSFEVVIVQKHPAKTFPSGKHYDERESMPRLEDWGVWGWTYPDLKNAETKLNRLAEAAIEPVSALTPFLGGEFSGRAGYKVPDRTVTCLNPKRGRQCLHRAGFDIAGKLGVGRRGIKTPLSGDGNIIRRYHGNSQLNVSQKAQ